MRFVPIIAALTLALAGCAGDAITGSPHGYSGRVDTFWADLSGVPTIIQGGEAALHSEYGPGLMRDMPSTFEADAVGNITATGVAAYWLARAAYCRAGGDCGRQ